jgi:hypothetical protein
MNGRQFYKCTAEFLDTESDDIVDVFTFSAKNQTEAEVKAWDEAEYNGFHVGTIRMIGQNA